MMSYLALRPALNTTAESCPLRRDYVGEVGRQIHVYRSTGAHGGDRLPVVCLHATAYAGRSLAPLVAAIGSDRLALALDTPGYGGSDRPVAGWSIEDYARALLSVFDELGLQQADVVGYHTGATLGLEMARLAPSRVRRLAVIGVPYFPAGAEREAWRRRLAHRTVLQDGLDQFEERWSFLVEQRPEGMTRERAFDNFVDDLRAWPDGWWAHEAAFLYDYDQHLRQIGQPVLALNPENHLADPTRRAAARMPDCTVSELPHLSHGIFDVAGQELANRIRAFFDS